jgi:uncharacterized protein YfeS
MIFVLNFTLFHKVIYAFAMNEMKINDKIIKNIRKFWYETKNNKRVNNQVKLFDEQQWERDYEIETIIIDKMQTIILPKAKTLERSP